jgi:hypothetical protein
MNSLMQPTATIRPKMDGYTPGDFTETALEPTKNILQQAQDMYPRLKGLDYGYKESPQTEGDKRQLEHWAAGEPGDDKYPRPSDLPLDKNSIEVFNKDIKPSDVAGDIVSHHLVNKDPTLKKINKEFESTLSSPTGKTALRELYAEALREGEDRPYKQWLDQTGKAQYLRGYAFDQFSKKSQDKFYSKQQKKILDKMKSYLKEEE